ncbi:MAG: DUF4349 domain-containing protein [Kineosporiaceae bacterium]
MTTPRSLQPSGTPRRSRVATALAIGLTLLGTGLLGACGSGSSSSGASAAGGEAAPAAAAPEAGVADQAGGAAGSAAKAGQDAGGSGDTAAAAAERRIVRTAEITVEVKQLAPAATRVRQLAADLGGFVATESTGYSAPVGAKSDTTSGKEVVREAQVGQSVLVLRVPEPKFTQALDRSAGVGTEVSRTSAAEDVTGDIADLTSRTATQKASVARVRQLLADAKSLSDVVLLEAELTKREAALEALEARLATLANQADLATLTVVLQTPEVAPVEEQNRFVRALSSGWDALVSATAVIVTLIGGLIPFAVVGAVIGIPLWRWRRSRRRPAARPMPGPAPTPDAQDPLIPAGFGASSGSQPPQLPTP